MMKNVFSSTTTISPATAIDDEERFRFLLQQQQISLKKFMELWEQQNQDVHGKTEAQQQSRRLQKLSIEIRKLHNLRDQT